jgi:DNA repair protein RecO (recombination protein O)
MYYQSRCIILKTSNLKEADKIVSIFSEKEGKISAVARGVKKPASSLRACVQPFCHSLLHLSRGKGLDIITQGKIIDFYADARLDFKRMLYSVYLMELLDKSLMERMPLNELYNTTLEVLQYINGQGASPLLIRLYELRLLSALGYKPIFNQCINCGSHKVLGFNIPEGGMLCSECAEQAAEIFRFSGESLAILRLLLNTGLSILGKLKVSQAALEQMEVFLEAYLEYHLERKFNMHKTIKTLKQKMML